MRRIKPLIALFAAMTIPLGGLMGAAPAMAYNLTAVYKDCENNGTLTGHYSRAQLQAALNNIPAQVSEYSSCQVLIQQALLKSSAPGGGHHPHGKNTVGGAGKHGGGGPGKGSARHHKGKTDTSATRRGRAAGTGRTTGVSPAGSDLRPGSSGAGGGSSSVPVALIVVLILIALTAVSGGVVAIRRRVDTGPGT